MAMGEPEAGMTTCSLFFVLFSQCKVASSDAFFWRGLHCSAEAWDGEDGEEEEEE